MNRSLPHLDTVKYYVSKFLFMCRFRGGHLIINLSYHTYISFILSPLPYNITYPSWLGTPYGCSSFMVWMWSYLWWSRYLFALVPLRKWMYNNPRYTLRYYCNWCFVEWNTCLEGGFPPFPPPHLMTSGYPNHQRWLLELVGHCHY
jgi:hypothetical protein